MSKSIIRTFLLSTVIGIISISTANIVHAASINASVSQPTTAKTHFGPRPSVSTRLDFDSWDFMLSETVLYMGPSTRSKAAKNQAQTGTRINRSHTTPYKMEGNKVLYSLMVEDVKSEMQAYAEELVALGNRLDIPSLPRNEQLAYWINLHNAVLVTTIADNYPGPKRRPNLIKPIKGSDAQLHDAKLIKIDDHMISLRDIREEIVFPNWKNGDVPYAFHLGYLGSPSMANVAYSGANLRAQLARNAYEFVNSLRGYDKGKLSPYIRDVSPWYYPGMASELDTYFQKRMRPEVFGEYKTHGVKTMNREDLVIADMTGGYGKNGGMERYYANLQTTADPSFLGAEIDKFLQDRAAKNLELSKKTWFRRGTVTIIDTPTDGESSDVE